MYTQSIADRVGGRAGRPRHRWSELRVDQIRQVESGLREYRYRKCHRSILRISLSSAKEWIGRCTHGHNPSVVPPYPALPRFPIVQNAGQKPPIPDVPGNETDTSHSAFRLKQTLFHDWIMPDLKLSSLMGS